MSPPDLTSPLAHAPPTAREWAYAAWNEGGGEALTVPLAALQRLLDELAHLRALAFAVENRLKVTVESTPSSDPEEPSTR
jgi:hypothetical protein